MAKYVGDSFTVTATLRDVTGALVDADPVTMLVKRPTQQGTATNDGPYTMTHISTGVYTYPYPSVEPGMHMATFSPTGSNAAHTGMVTFYVEPLRPGLVTEAETQIHLRINDSSWATYRDRILLWIQASRRLIEGVTGQLTVVAQDDWMDGGHPVVMVLEPPIVTVTAITETFGANIVRTLTNQPIDGNASVNAYGYTVDDYWSGKITRRVTGLAAPFALGRNNIHVQYTSGIAGEWDPNIRLANLELLRLWWVASQDQSNPQPESGPEYDEAPSTLVGELPPRVERMLGRRDEHGQGIG
jgi:hypothetical protein